MRETNLRQKLLSLLLGIVAMGCGSSDPITPFYAKPTVEPPDYFHDPDLEVYVLEFLGEADDRGLPPGHRDRLWQVKYVEPEAFGDPDRVVLGRCLEEDLTEADTGKVVEWYLHIYILQKAKEWDPLMKKVLLYHELFHCSYGLPHLESAEDSNELMSPYMYIDPEAWREPWPQRLNRAFADAIAVWGTAKR
jgi:hypothetical protein